MKHALVFILFFFFSLAVSGQEHSTGGMVEDYSGVNTKDSDEKFPGAKKDVNLTITSLRINGFKFEPNGFGTKVSSGFWGLSFGGEYYYKSNKFIGLKSAVATDFGLPIHTTPDDVSESFYTTYIELTDNFKFGRWYFGYGINYARNSWWYTDALDPENVISIRRVNKSFGISTNAYFQIAKPFFIGLVYRPTIFRVSPVTDFKYEHLISLDIAFKIPLICNEL